MKFNLLLSFLATILMVFVMRYQGQALETNVAPRGIIDLEFARTPERLQQLQGAWQWPDVRLNLLLDFIFIGAYVWFFAAATLNIKQQHDWTRAGAFFMIAAFIAGLLDVIENGLMYLAFTNSSGPATLTVISYCATIKFVLIAVLIIYILLSFLFVRKSRT